MIIINKSGYLKNKNLRFRCALGKGGVKKKIKEKFLHLSNREKIVRKKYLKGLIASRDIKKNTKIKSAHIKICRPLGNGFEPKYFTKIIGKKTRNFIKADNNFKQSDISK